MDATKIGNGIKALIENHYAEEMTERLRHEIQAKLSRVFRENNLAELKFHVLFDYDNGQVTLEGERPIDKLAISALNESIKQIKNEA